MIFSTTLAVLGAMSSASAISAPVAPAAPHGPILNAIGGVPTPLSWPINSTITMRYDAALGDPSTFPASIVPGSTPRIACNAGAAVWTAIAPISIVDGGLTSATSVGADGTNLVTFSDPALAAAGFIAAAFVFSNVTDGTIFESDIGFSGAFLFDTTGTAPTAFDIQHVAAHEYGHLLGLEHSAIVGSSLFPFTPPGARWARTLADDDIAGIQTLYPTVQTFNAVGAVQGQLTRAFGGVIVPIPGAHILAIDSVDGRVVAATFSDANGNYLLTGVPAGLYNLQAEPLDGPVLPGNLIGTSWATVAFDTTFGEARTGSVTVRNAQITTRNFSAVTPANASIQAMFANCFGIGVSGNPLTTAPLTLVKPPAGLSYNCSLFLNGPGINPTGAPAPAGPMAVNVSPGITITGPFQGGFFTGAGGVMFPYARYQMTITPQVAPGQHNIVLNTYTGPILGQGGQILFSGAIDIVETSPPTAQSIVYGTGCSGLGGPLTMSSTGLPTLGAPYSATVGPFAANEHALLVTTEFAGIDNLSGVSGCTSALLNLGSLLPDPFGVTVGPFGGGPTGTVTFDLSIPNIPILAGFTFHHQAFAVSTSAAVRTSPGLRSVIQ